MIEINLTHLHSNKIEDGFQYTIEVPICRKLSVLLDRVICNRTEIEYAKFSQFLQIRV